MKKTRIKTLTIIIGLFFISTCSTWSMKDWEKIENRNFYFSKFFIYRKGSNRQEAFDVMKNFPVREIAKIISNKYNINVDVSEFEDFIFFGNVSKIKVSGLLIESNYVWESGDKNPNTVELEYVCKLDDQTVTEIKDFRIILKSNGKDRASFFGNLYDSDPLLVIVADRLGYSRLNKDSDDFYVNNITKEKVDLRTGPEDEKTIARRKKIITNSEEQIKQQIKDYIKDMPQDKKRKFRDDIIKYLYKVIE